MGVGFEECNRILCKNQNWVRGQDSCSPFLLNPLSRAVIFNDFDPLAFECELRGKGRLLGLDLREGGLLFFGIGFHERHAVGVFGIHRLADEVAVIAGRFHADCEQGVATFAYEARIFKCLDIRHAVAPGLGRVDARGN